MTVGLWETGAAGWVEVSAPELRARVLVKVAEKGGRVVIERLLVNAEAIDAATLRSIPLTRIEATLNQHGIGAELAGEQPPLIERMPTFAAELGQIDEGLARYLAGRETPGAGPEPERTPEPLQRPDGSDPEGFYRRVAEVYSRHVMVTSTPAKFMAEEASVPAATVHRWIFEARRRGFLPPARKGRAG